MKELTIVKALYGTKDSDFVDVTDIIRRIVGLGCRSFCVCNNVFGVDPNKNIPKYLYIQWDDGFRKVYGEHTHVELEHVWDGSTCHSLGQKISRRNLIYHVAPMTRGKHIWKRNIDLLKTFGDKALNGKRVVGIATGHGMDSVKEVLDQFGDFRIDQLMLNLNHPNGETQTIVPALPMIASERPDECFFYAHTKGVSWAGNKFEFGTSEWTECMYRCLFEHVDQVDQELMSFPVVGAIKMHIRDNPFDSIYNNVHYPPYGWMYSGSFFACRHNTFFCNKHWNDIWESNNDKYFIERFPAIFFRNDEAGTIFKERDLDVDTVFPGGGMLYEREYWEKTDWRKELSNSLLKRVSQDRS